MQIEVRRKQFGPKATIGEMWIDGIFECYTLEDVVRAPGVKIYGETAIPYGTYGIEIRYCSKLSEDVPHLLDVPMFTDILIHQGNTDIDTEGCILVGQKVVNDDFIGNSRLAFSAMFPKLDAAEERGEVITISIIKGDGPLYQGASSGTQL